MELLENNGTTTVTVQNQPAATPAGRRISGGINIKREVGKYLRKWPWLLLSMLLFYTAAKIYLRYKQPQYLSQTTLKLQQTKQANNALGDLKSMGMGVAGDDELITETSMVKSKPILMRVAINLNLPVSFYSVGRVIESELYKDSPLQGKVLPGSPDHFYNSYIIKPVGANGFILETEDNKEVLKGRFGIPFATGGFKAVVSAKPGFGFSQPLKVVFQGVGSAATALEGAINVAIPPNKGMLMDISMVGPVPAKSEDILNEVSKQYNIESYLDKNAEAQDTEDFIDGRLAVISGDLSGIENEKAGFKRANQITDLESQASLSLADASEYTKKVIETSSQLDLVNGMLGATNTDGLMPVGMGAPGSSDALVTQYNELLLTRNRTLKQATNANPAVVEMNKQLATLKNLIRKNLIESRETLQLQIAQDKARINVAKGNISKFPEQEKLFRSIERQQNLKEQLYLYLLQKREENAITLAVKAPKAKVLNPAYTVGMVQPNYQMVTLGSLAAGFLLPLLFFVGANVLDTKIYSKEQIEVQNPEAPVIAEVPINREEPALIKTNDFSVFAESFRILSSNLKFMLKTKNGADKGVILVTSSVKGEGKTTVSMNTALTLSGKSKTIIIGADIRNPQLQRFISDRKPGLTDFLVSEESTPENFIVPSGMGSNLDVMFSGQIAPNPNDLLDMDKFDRLSEWLRGQYNYVILDTAPVMLVSDTLHILDQVDVVLYVVKGGVTEKDMLNFAANFQLDNRVKNMAYVLNGAQPQHSRYGSKYGYGYYSYTHEQKVPWYKRIF